MIDRAMAVARRLDTDGKRSVQGHGFTLGLVVLCVKWGPVVESNHHARAGLLVGKGIEFARFTRARITVEHLDPVFAEFDPARGSTLALGVEAT